MEHVHNYNKFTDIKNNRKTGNRCKKKQKRKGKGYFSGMRFTGRRRKSVLQDSQSQIFKVWIQPDWVDT